MALTDDLAATKAALSQIGTDADKIGADVTLVQGRLTALLGQIASATDLQAAKDLATQAQAEVTKLDAVTVAMDALGSATA